MEIGLILYEIQIENTGTLLKIKIVELTLCHYSGYTVYRSCSSKLL